MRKNKTRGAKQQTRKPATIKRWKNARTVERVEKLLRKVLPNV